MTKIEIRESRAADAPGLQQIAAETGLFPPEMLAGMLDPVLAGEAEAIWLTGLIDNQIAGFCYAVPEALTDGTWNMLALAVSPGQQGSGLGAALVRGLEDRLRGASQRVLIVDTSGTEAFARTRRFYAQNLYEEEARIRDYWAAGDDKVIFRKALQ